MSLWHTPIILLTLLTWLQSPPVSLADASRREALRRQLMPPAVRSLTTSDVQKLPARPLPTPLPTPAPPAQPGPAAPVALPSAQDTAESHDEKWWRTRLARAREALDRDRVLMAAVQSRINALTLEWSAQDDPAQRETMWNQRERALAELGRLSAQIEGERAGIEGIQEEARRRNVPAEWVR
jgi:hypothetical protein